MTLHSTEDLSPEGIGALARTLRPRKFVAPTGWVVNTVDPVDQIVLTRAYVEERLSIADLVAVLEHWGYESASPHKVASWLRSTGHLRQRAKPTHASDISTGGPVPYRAGHDDQPSS